MPLVNVGDAFSSQAAVGVVVFVSVVVCSWLGCKGFRSCFLSFGAGARIEVMTTTTLSPAVVAAI